MADTNTVLARCSNRGWWAGLDRFKFVTRALLVTATASMLPVHAQQAADEADAIMASRVAQMEQELESAQAAIAALQAQQKISQPADAVPPIQARSIVPKAIPDSRFSYGGFIRAEGIYTRTPDGEIAQNSLGRRQYAPGAIPVEGSAESPESVDFNTTVQHSRFWFTVDSTSDSTGRVISHIEMDFGTDINGNQLSTNSYTPRVRHAYVGWSNWLAGQYWSNFQDATVLPESAPLLGPTEGTVFVRQVQLRYIKGPWIFTAENPETLLAPFGGGTRISSDDNNLPDLTARRTWRGKRGHFGIAGIVRQLRYETGAGSSDAWGYGISGAGRVKLGSNDDLMGMLSAGTGIGRYFGFALNPDGVLDANGDIEPLPLTAGYIGWRHGFTPRLRSNLYASAAFYDNDTELTGTAITKRVHSVHTNVVYSPLTNFDVGSELIWAHREVESGRQGDLYRLHSFVRYSF